MAPEQAKGKKVDKRADIWSWGVVLYELLTGERLFKGGDATDTLAQVLTKEPPLERVPPQVRRLLGACLQKDPKQRLKDIGDAKPLLAGKSATAPSRSRLGWVAAAMFALVAAGLGWIAWRATQPVERPLMQLSAELGGGLSLALSVGGSIALSPNGTLLSLIVRGADGQTHLATRPGTEGAQGPFFSPDGRWIAFSTKGALKKIAAQGGAPVPLYNAYSLVGSWGDDGFNVAVLGISAGLTRIPETGGMPTPITQIKPVRIRRPPLSAGAAGERGRAIYELQDLAGSGRG
jgi:serine/threonine-protein kinase